MIKRIQMIVFVLTVFTVVFYGFATACIVRAEETTTSEDYGEKVQQEADDKADRAVNSVGAFAETEVEKAKGASGQVTLSNGYKTSVRLLKSFYRVYEGIKSMAGIIISVSVFIGILIFVLSRKNKQWRRLGLYMFVIAIPLLVLLVVYGVGTLNGIYLYEAGNRFEVTEEYTSLVTLYQAYLVDMSSGVFRGIMNGFYNAYAGIRAMSSLFLVMFEIQGIIRVVLCKYDKKERDIGLYGFCIGIPLALIFVGVGTKLLNHVFM